MSEPAHTKWGLRPKQHVPVPHRSPAKSDRSPPTLTGEPPGKGAGAERSRSAFSVIWSHENTDCSEKYKQMPEPAWIYVSCGATVSEARATAIPQSTRCFHRRRVSPPDVEKVLSKYLVSRDNDQLVLETNSVQKGLKILSF